MFWIPRRSSGPRASSSSPAMAPRPVEAAAQAPNLAFVRQEPQLGTGHAVQQAVPLLARRRHDADPQRRRAADRGDDARALVAACEGDKLALLTVELDDPRGYGRVLRGDPPAATRTKAAHPSHRRGQGREPERSRHPRGLHRRDGGADRGAEALARRAAQRQRAARVLPDRCRRGGRRRRDAGRRRASPDDAEVLGVNSPLQLAELERRCSAGVPTR